MGSTAHRRRDPDGVRLAGALALTFSYTAGFLLTLLLLPQLTLARETLNGWPVTLGVLLLPLILVALAQVIVTKQAQGGRRGTTRRERSLRPRGQ